jgi:hypothetical protein
MGLAVINNHLEVVEFLLKKGMTIHIVIHGFDVGNMKRDTNPKIIELLQTHIALLK